MLTLHLDYNFTIVTENTYVLKMDYFFVGKEDESLLCWKRRWITSLTQLIPSLFVTNLNQRRLVVYSIYIQESRHKRMIHIYWK